MTMREPTLCLLDCGGIAREDLASLVQRPQATRAHVHAARLAIDCHARALNIGLELATGCLFGVADVVAKLRALAADVTLCHAWILVIHRN